MGITGICDSKGMPIFVGDTLESKWSYRVIVYKENGEFLGKLVCDADHPCANIPYSLGNGEDYTFVPPSKE